MLETKAITQDALPEISREQRMQMVSDLLDEMIADSIKRGVFKIDGENAKEYQANLPAV
jgi:hypothetical protein